MLKELRRFGDNNGLTGKMTIRSKRGLSTPSAPRPVCCIFFIISMSKASLEKTQRNKFPGDSSQCEPFISNTRDNWFQNSSISTNRQEGFFLPPPTHSPFRSPVPLEKQSCCLRGSDPTCSLWMQSNARPLFEFPGNPSPSVQVSSGGEGKRIRYHAGYEGLFLELSSKKPHLPMCSVKMEKGDFTPEAGGFWDFHLLTQHRMDRQARGS